MIIVDVDDDDHGDDESDVESDDDVDDDWNLRHNPSGSPYWAKLNT